MANKENVLLLTGWGASHRVWDSIIPALETGCQINNVIPTWSDAAQVQGSLCALDHYVDAIANAYIYPHHVVAWSLGGSVAIRLAARHPDMVKDIIFIASTPKFVSADNHQAGIIYDEYEALKKSFIDAPTTTLKAFQALQVVGDENARGILKQLRKYDDYAHFDIQELKAGLDMLEQDFSAQLDALSCPTYFILGQDDAVINSMHVQYFARQTQSEYVMWPRVGHVPQLSCPERVVDQIATFLNLS